MALEKLFSRNLHDDPRGDPHGVPQGDGLPPRFHNGGLVYRDGHDALHDCWLPGRRSKWSTN